MTSFVWYVDDDLIVLDAQDATATGTVLGEYFEGKVIIDVNTVDIPINIKYFVKLWNVLHPELALSAEDVLLEKDGEHFKFGAWKEASVLTPRPYLFDETVEFFDETLPPPLNTKPLATVKWHPENYGGRKVTYIDWAGFEPVYIPMEELTGDDYDRLVTELEKRFGPHTVSPRWGEFLREFFFLPESVYSHTKAGLEILLWIKRNLPGPYIAENGNDKLRDAIRGEPIGTSEWGYEEYIVEASWKEAAIEHIKYPRTPHLPWSPGFTDDDIRTTENDVGAMFEGHQVIVLEKMDGENTTMYSDHIHARSLDSRNHPSRNWVKALHGQIAHEIPEGWRICGENLQAQHSIVYGDLPSYFMVFSIWDDTNTCLSWAETKEWAELLGLEVVPTIYEGPFDRDAIEAAWKSHASPFGDVEGYVIRKADRYGFDEFTTSVAKWVRPNHVQTDQHWIQGEMKENGLLRREAMWKEAAPVRGLEAMLYDKKWDNIIYKPGVTEHYDLISDTPNRYEDLELETRYERGLYEPRSATLVIYLSQDVARKDRWVKAVQKSGIPLASVKKLGFDERGNVTLVPLREAMWKEAMPPLGMPIGDKGVRLGELGESLVGLIPGMTVIGDIKDGQVHDVDLEVEYKGQRYGVEVKSNSRTGFDPYRYRLTGYGRFSLAQIRDLKREYCESRGLIPGTLGITIDFENSTFDACLLPGEIRTFLGGAKTMVANDVPFENKTGVRPLKTDTMMEPRIPNAFKRPGENADPSWKYKKKWVETPEEDIERHFGSWKEAMPWHVSPKKNRDSILEHGLDHTKGKSPYNDSEWMNHYDLGHQERGNFFMQDRADRKGIEKWGPENEEKDFWYLHPDFAELLDMMQDRILGPDAMYTKQPVPPEWLERYDPEDFENAWYEKIKRRSNILDPIQETLDPDVFDLSFDPPEPRLSIFEGHLNHLRERFRQHGFDPKAFRFYLTGSICTYQYSDTSDCDISVVATEEMSDEERSYLIKNVILSIDGDKFPGTNYPFQHFVQPYGVDIEDIFVLGNRAAYDFEDREWVSPPNKDRATDVKTVYPDWYAKAVQTSDKMNALLDAGDKDAAWEYYKQIHDKRAADQKKYGDFSEGNIQYKFLVNNGTFDRLRTFGFKITTSLNDYVIEHGHSPSGEYEEVYFQDPENKDNIGKVRWRAAREDEAPAKTYVSFLGYTFSDTEDCYPGNDLTNWPGYDYPSGLDDLSGQARMRYLRETYPNLARDMLRWTKENLEPPFTAWVVNGPLKKLLENQPLDTFVGSWKEAATGQSVLNDPRFGLLPVDQELTHHKTNPDPYSSGPWQEQAHVSEDLMAFKVHGRNEWIKVDSPVTHLIVINDDHFGITPYGDVVGAVTQDGTVYPNDHMHPRYMWHVTHSFNRESIKTHGLLPVGDPANENRQVMGNEALKGVFMFKNQSDISYWIGHIDRPSLKNWNSENDDLFDLNPENPAQAPMYVHTEQIFDNPEKELEYDYWKIDTQGLFVYPHNMGDWIWISPDAIPPERLTLVHTTTQGNSPRFNFASKWKEAATGAALDGVMLALVPDDTSSLVVPDGEPESNLHCTLVFLGEDADDVLGDEDSSTLEAVAKQLASELQPVTVHTGAIEALGDKEPPAQVVLLEKDALDKFHVRALELLDENDWHVEEKFPEYKPHVTLTYDSEAPEIDVPGEITFSTLRLAIGGNNYDFPLRNTERTSSAMVLYHGTAREFLPKIQAEGLRRPHLTSNIELAEYFAEEVGGDDVVLRVEVPDLNLLPDAAMFSDLVQVGGLDEDEVREQTDALPSWPPTWQQSLEIVHSVIYNGVIPPENISVVPGWEESVYREGHWREAMAERSGNSSLDQAIEEFIQTNPCFEGVSSDPEWYGEYTDEEIPLQGMRNNPEKAWGQCLDVARAFNQFLRDNHPEIRVGWSKGEPLSERMRWLLPQLTDMWGYEDRQTQGLESHEATLVEVDGQIYMVDFTAAQYGYTEFPMVQRLTPENKWERQWTAAIESELVSTDPTKTAANNFGSFAEEFKVPLQKLGRVWTNFGPSTADVDIPTNWVLSPIDGVVFGSKVPHGNYMYELEKQSNPDALAFKGDDFFTQREDREGKKYPRGLINWYGDGQAIVLFYRSTYDNGAEDAAYRVADKLEKAGFIVPRVESFNRKRNDQGSRGWAGPQGPPRRPLAWRVSYMYPEAVEDYIRDTGNEYFYHTTKEGLIPRIFEQGLLPGNMVPMRAFDNASPLKSRDNYVYLTVKGNPASPYPLRIPIRSLKPSLMGTDEDMFVFPMTHSENVSDPYMRLKDDAEASKREFGFEFPPEDSADLSEWQWSNFGDWANEQKGFDRFDITYDSLKRLGHIAYRGRIDPSVIELNPAWVYNRLAGLMRAIARPYSESREDLKVQAEKSIETIVSWVEKYSPTPDNYLAIQKAYEAGERYRMGDNTTNWEEMKQDEEVLTPLEESQMNWTWESKQSSLDEYRIVPSQMRGQSAFDQQVTFYSPKGRRPIGKIQYRIVKKGDPDPKQRGLIAENSYTYVHYLGYTTPSGDYSIENSPNWTYPATVEMVKKNNSYIRSRYPNLGRDMLIWVKQNLPPPYKADFENQKLKKIIEPHMSPEQSVIKTPGQPGTIGYPGAFSSWKEASPLMGWDEMWSPADREEWVWTGPGEGKPVNLTAPDKLYHVAPSSARESIRLLGLYPTNSDVAPSPWKGEYDEPEERYGIYAWAPSPFEPNHPLWEAHMYGEGTVPLGPDDTYDIWEIDHANHWFEPDEPGEPTAWWTKQHVPPSALRLVEQDQPRAQYN